MVSVGVTAQVELVDAVVLAFELAEAVDEGPVAVPPPQPKARPMPAPPIAFKACRRSIRVLSMGGVSSFSFSGASQDSAKQVLSQLK